MTAGDGAMRSTLRVRIFVASGGAELGFPEAKGVRTMARGHTIRPGPWAFGHPRVLIEHSDEGAVISKYVPALRRAGYSVAVCHGPSAERQPPESCVLVTGERCVAVQGADVVVSGLGASAPEKRAVLEALHRFHPRKPLVVEVSTGELDLYGELVDGAHLIVSPVEPEELVAAVGDALATDAE